MTVVLSETAAAAKARGAFYTPPEITRYLATWAVRSGSDWVLEPSAGNGAFLSAITERFAELSADEQSGGVLAIEREPNEARAARRLAPSAEVRAVDFFDLDPSATRRFTAVVGNPPYIRYQSFRGADRDKATARARGQGVELSGLASSWAHFVVHAVGFLAERGRMALVLPAELLHTDYADPVRALLTRRFRSVTIVAFDRAAFRTAQVDAVLLLASNDEPPGFRVIRVDGVEALYAVDAAQPAASASTPRRWSGAVDQAAGDVYERAKAEVDSVSMGALAHVDIGFVSGASDFFVVTRAQAAELGLPSSLLTPAVRRPADVPGLYVREGEAQCLVDLAGQGELSEAVRRYLSAGELLGIHQRYKCRTRSPWYAVPLPRRMPDAFLPYMNHRAPRLIVNGLGARNSNLLHGVALKADAPSPAAIAVAMTSSLTLLSAEIEGRAYGGGVLKLETKEAERLVMPDPATTRDIASLLPDVDQDVRSGDLKRAAEVVDSHLGIPHDRLWKAYEALRQRRLGRRQTRQTRVTGSIRNRPAVRPSMDKRRL